MHRRFLAALAILATVTACGSDNPAAPTGSASVAGSWALRSINGTALPYTLQNGNTRADVLGSTLTVTDGGTWAEVVSVRVTVNGGAPTNQTGAASGTYARAGTGLSLTETDGGQNASYLTCALVDSHTLTCASGAISYVYAR